MKEESGGTPHHVVTVKTDRVVTLATSFTLVGAVPQVTMQAERQHKEAWRRLAHQPGVTLGAVVDVKAWGIMLEALRLIAKSEGPHGSIAGIAREALFQIGDRSVAPLDDTDLP
jgi:hypothetical protein